MKRFFSLIIIGLVLGGLVWTGCQKKAEEKVLKVGAILPLTGDGAQYGEKAKRGIELALEDINSKKIIGENIKIIYEDSQGEPQKSVSAFQKLINIDKVKFVLGPATSPEVLSIAPLAERNKVLILTSTASAPEITHAGDYIFRNVMSDIFDGKALALFAFKKLKEKRAGIMYVNNDYGNGLAKSFKKNFESLGGKVEIEQSFERTDADFRTQLTRIKGKRPDVILLFGMGYTDMGIILRQSVELGIKTQILSHSLFEDPEILKLAGKGAEGVYYTYRVFDPDSEEEVVKKFVEKFERKYRAKPDVYSALFYDAMRILAYALEKGGVSVERCKNALYNIKDFPGVVGETTFDKNGDVIKPIGIKKVENGKFVWIYKTFETEGKTK
ncbi:MAG: penicillin-binding protein activator [Thermoplasmatales archaeon]|nr:penicillin-binding protein activator [Thermoplasmatales archaeon]